MEAVALRLLIVVASVAAMEVVAALVHRHWMHGPGWAWHRSHHRPGTQARLQRNDLYALVFTASAVALFALGRGRWWPLYWIGVGMSVISQLRVVPEGDGSRLEWNARIEQLKCLMSAVSPTLIKAAADQVIRHAWSAVRKELGEA